jgi:hypothetical protein
MRIIVTLMFASVIADPCNDLCKHDGPQICTGGSWTKGNGECHAYVYKGDSASEGYCYHTAATAATCPSKGKRPVQAIDVPNLLGAAVATTINPVEPTTQTMLQASAAAPGRISIGFSGDDLVLTRDGLVVRVAVPNGSDYADAARRLVTQNGIMDRIMYLIEIDSFGWYRDGTDANIKQSAPGREEFDCVNVARPGKVLATFNYTGVPLVEMGPHWRQNFCSAITDLKMQLFNNL